MEGIDFVVTVLFGADDTSKHGGFDIDFNVDRRHAIRVSNDVAHHVVRARELWVDLRANGDETTWDGVHELVVIGHKRDDN